ncbi:hypothetical protein QAD02_008900 [Eretmocerus hayati]|uniref:Uncharacterized protein n=1 Tax=Eretmocerus hayati TaxID=131215 RepID=A0ACC2N820_9HYME|nr:hypothetical protein QAD02_008900 [Eretmocerus hayati]
MRTARATGEMLPDDAASAAVASEGGPVGNVIATDGEATSSDNAALIDAASSGAGIVAAGAVDAASRDATTGNAIDDPAIGRAASRATASYDAALGDASLGGVAVHQDTSIGAANNVVLGLGVRSVSRGSTEMSKLRESIEKVQGQRCMLHSSLRYLVLLMFGPKARPKVNQYLDFSSTKIEQRIS